MALRRVRILIQSLSIPAIFQGRIDRRIDEQLRVRKEGDRRLREEIDLQCSTVQKDQRCVPFEGGQQMDAFKPKPQCLH